MDTQDMENHEPSREKVAFEYTVTKFLWNFLLHIVKEL